MNSLFKYGFILASLLWLTACIEPYDVKIENPEKLLVVNGQITNLPGPYEIKLNTSYSYGQYFGSVDPEVTGATLIIQDEAGTSETLTEIEPGIYQTKEGGIQGVAGRKYKLLIHLKNGKQYASETETLQAVPEIDKLYGTVKATTELNEDGNEVPRNYVQIMVDVKDPANVRNFYKWNFTNTFEITTQPEDHISYDKKGNPYPDPKPCCRQCWITKNSSPSTVTSDQQFNGNSLAGQQVAIFPFAPEFFQNKFFIEVTQYAISEEAFTFWNTLNGQIAGGGSVQPPAPANAIGNIKNMANPNEKVIGFFGAAGAVKKSIFINPGDLGSNPGVFIFPDDCQEYPGATTDRPFFW